MARKNIESSHQKAFFSWLSYYPRIRYSTFHIPNGGYRNKIEAANLKKSGVLSGVPDVFVAIPSMAFSGLFIEFKAGKNKLTDNQRSMIDRLVKDGYECKICYSWFEARDMLKEYFGKDLLDV
jgi:hypothetical protein